MPRSALILIDLQVDYLSGGDLIEGQESTLLQSFPELPTNVAKVLALARAQDEVDVIHIREKDQPAHTSTWLPWWDKLHPRKEGENCGLGIESSPEPWAQELSSEAVFTKHTYDAFQSGEMSVSLCAHLKARGVQRLFFCGVLTKACVMFSANSAFNLGFEVLVVGDCCADRTREHHDMALHLYDGYHIKVVQADDTDLFTAQR